MSAFLCSDRHTFALALWMASGATSKTLPPSSPSVVAVAQRLRRLNNAALLARYRQAPEALPDDPTEAIDAAVEWLLSATHADIYQAARCFRYQCSEGDCEAQPDWPFLEALCGRAEALAAGQESDVWSI